MKTARLDSGWAPRLWPLRVPGAAGWPLALATLVALAMTILPPTLEAAVLGLTHLPTAATVLGADERDASAVEPQDGSAPAATTEGLEADAEPGGSDENPAHTPEGADLAHEEAELPWPQWERTVPVEYPDRDGSQPDWLEGSPHWEGETFLAPVKSRVHPTIGECRRALDEAIKEATDAFINELLDSRRAAQLVGYNADELSARQDQLVRATFEETVAGVTGGPMPQTHALLAFDPAFSEEVEQRWEQVKASSRLLQLGGGSGVILLLLALMFGYSRLDTATRGYYTRRLQFAALAAILAVVAASVVVARWIPWL